MNKYQKRRNKVMRFKPLLSKKQVNSIIYDDDTYNSFLNLVREFERKGMEIYKAIIKGAMKNN
ncbi:hypothetical protein B0H39_003433 [Clostridium beijerinckii]|uniref:hypothetical protein n=1 Tax=Clostridium beijerinckii TaxID=1520 RepID=UPI00149430D9|nr:hypothetical protein [Clostridium beijerinckii]NOW85552.1 hypothetical protein [Clostridium beijerinckii]